MERRREIALDDLQLDQLIVIYPGEQAYPLRDNVTAIPLNKFVFQQQEVGK